MKKRNPTVRFSATHIKKMMQVDEDIGKMSHAVPAMVGKAVELFSTILVQKAGDITNQRGAKTLTQEHVATVIKQDPRFDFLVDLVKGIGQDTLSDSDRPVKVLTKTVKKNEEFKDLDKVDKLSKSKKGSQRLRNNQSGKISREDSGRDGIPGIELTMKVMPVQNQFVEAGERVMQTGAKLVQVDEDYD